MSKYRIYSIDAFEWLRERKAKTIHAVVTDPPFAITEFTPDQLQKRKNGNGGIWRIPHNYDGCKRNPVPRFTVLGPRDVARIKEFHDRLAPLLLRVLVPGGHVIIASQNLLAHILISSFCESGLELRGQIVRQVWTLRGGDRPKGAHEEFALVSVTPRGCWEPWVIFRRPCEGRVSDNLRKWFTGGLRRPSESSPFVDVFPSAPPSKKEREIAPHPSLKPQSFLHSIVGAALPLHRGVLLDPFMGSGSTVAAAEALGLKSIGLEINKEYFELAQKAIPNLVELGKRTNGGIR